MKTSLIALSLAGALLLGGCENSMRADVTQFSTMAGVPAGRSFAVVAEPAQSGSLEFQYYAGLVGGALAAHGFAPAPVNSLPDVVVQIHYASAGNHTEIYGDPAWGPGPWGPGWGWHHRGLWGPGVESATFYGESLEVDLFDGPAWRNNVHTMLYQGRAVGDATVNDVSAAVPSLVKALFTHFPGNSGQTERVVVPISDDGHTPLAPGYAPPANAVSAPKTST